MATKAQVLEALRSEADPRALPGMARYGIRVEGRLGVSMPELRRIAKEAGRDHALALALWKTGIAEARIVASLVADPKALSEGQMDAWVEGFDSWDVCDQTCMNLFDRTPHAVAKVSAWAAREDEFVRRAAFALIASLAVHDKKAGDGTFLAFLPLIERAAADDRNFVKKAVNWALRQIGKRNEALNRAVLECARKIQRIDSKAARWIAADAIRELESEAVRERLRNKR